VLFCDRLNWRNYWTNKNKILLFLIKEIIVEDNIIFKRNNCVKTCYEKRIRNYDRWFKSVSYWEKTTLILGW